MVVVEGGVQASPMGMEAMQALEVAGEVMVLKHSATGVSEEAVKVAPPSNLSMIMGPQARLDHPVVAQAAVEAALSRTGVDEGDRRPCSRSGDVLRLLALDRRPGPSEFEKTAAGSGGFSRVRLKRVCTATPSPDVGA